MHNYNLDASWIATHGKNIRKISKIFARKLWNNQLVIDIVIDGLKKYLYDTILASNEFHVTI